jgi:hypothetical protein
MLFNSRFIVGDLKIGWSFGDVLSASHLASYLPARLSSTTLLVLVVFYFFQRTGMRKNFTYPFVCWLSYRSEFQAVSQFAFKKLMVHSPLFPEG